MSLKCLIQTSGKKKGRRLRKFWRIRTSRGTYLLTSLNQRTIKNSNKMKRFLTKLFNHRLKMTLQQTNPRRSFEEKAQMAPTCPASAHFKLKVQFPLNRSKAKKTYKTLKCLMSAPITPFFNLSKTTINPSYQAIQVRQSRRFK
jgi:hypothetical protein